MHGTARQGGAAAKLPLTSSNRSIERYGAPPLSHEASKRHALQHLGEEVILRQPPLPKEGCLEEGRVCTVSSTVQASVILADVAE